MLTLEFFYSWQYLDVPTEMQDTGLHGGFTKEGCTLKEQAVTQTNTVCDTELYVLCKYKYWNNTTQIQVQIQLQTPHE